MKKKLFAAVLAVFGTAAVIFWCASGEDSVADRPPELIVAWGGEEVIAWMGSSQWMWPEEGSMRSVIADAPHPLDVMDDLPVISAEAGDELVLAFEGVPDKADVICYWLDDKGLTACPMGNLSAGSRLILPKNCSGTLWIVEGKWETGESTGWAEYAFRVA